MSGISLAAVWRKSGESLVTATFVVLLWQRSGRSLAKVWLRSLLSLFRNVQLKTTLALKKLIVFS